MDGRLWISKLYEVFFPSFYALGSPSNWNISLVPETMKAVTIVKDWIRELLYNIDPTEHRIHFLTFFLQATSLSLVLNGHEPLDYVFRARCMQPPIPYYLLFNPGEPALAYALRAIQNIEFHSITKGMLFLM